MHHAPEIDVDQPLHLRLVDLVEAAEQGDAGIVDDDVEARMRGDCGLRKILDLRGLADIDAMRRDLAPGIFPISAATSCSPASSRSASARSQPRAASSSARARPMPLAAPVTAAALPDIAVIGCPMQARRKTSLTQSSPTFSNRN